MEVIKKNQNGTSREENTMTKIKILLDRINSTLDTEEKIISELEDIAIDCIQNETEIVKWQEKINEQSISDL